MDFIFERMFFFLKEWFKYSQYFVYESGNPELKVVKDLKENWFPLGLEERHLLFYQKPQESINEEDFERINENKKQDFKLDCTNKKNKKIFLYF